jgi:hypothetical protein
MTTAQVRRGEQSAPELSGPRLPRGVISAALVAGPLLMIAGAFLDPPGAGPSERELVQVYADNMSRMDISATVLHLAFVMFALGLFGAGCLAHGKGRRLALTGGVASFVAFTFVSGFLLFDWVSAVLGRELGVDAAADLMNQIDGPGLALGWVIPQVACLLLGPVVLAVGLARAGLVPWWLVAMPALASVAQLVDGPPLAVLVPFTLLTVYGIALARVVRRS